MLRLEVGEVPKAPCEMRCKQGQGQDFQSDIVRSGCLKAPHAERQRSIHHDYAPFHLAQRY
jgi:hypothetical protein